jgi:succinylornithine aminotransferase
MKSEAAVEQGHVLKGEKLQKVVEREDFDDLITPVYSPTHLIPVRGEGSHVWDADGRRYVDLAGGVAVTALGHAHPELVAALSEQSQTIWHVGNVFTNEPVLKLARKLTEATFAERVFFANSGAEANEAALKLARRWSSLMAPDSKKTEVVAFDQSFHGRTLFTVSVGGQAKYRDGFGPLPGDIKHLPFNDLEAVREGIGDRTCAVIVELVQGESGVRPAAPDFVQALRQRCDETGALLIFDEVQTGVGRTGSLFAYMQYGVVPDILMTAKALGNGFPIGAMLTLERIGMQFSAGTHGSTFGGNPLAASVASRVLEIVDQQETMEGVCRRSEICFEGLRGINKRHELFADIRGRGLLIGAELRSEYAGQSGRLVEAAYRAGVFTLMAGPNVLRLAPSLLIPENVLIEGLRALDAAVKEFVSSVR